MANPKCCATIITKKGDGGCRRNAIPSLLGTCGNKHHETEVRTYAQHEAEQYALVVEEYLSGGAISLEDANEVRDLVVRVIRQKKETASQSRCLALKVALVESVGYSRKRDREVADSVEAQHYKQLRRVVLEEEEDKQPANQRPAKQQPAKQQPANQQPADNNRASAEQQTTYQQKDTVKPVYPLSDDMDYGDDVVEGGGSPEEVEMDY